MWNPQTYISLKYQHLSFRFYLADKAVHHVPSQTQDFSAPASTGTACPAWDQGTQHLWDGPSFSMLVKGAALRDYTENLGSTKEVLGAW